MGDCVLCRHGARTPLTDSYWDGVKWEAESDCGTLPGALRIALTDMNGGPQPPPSHDAIQVRSMASPHLIIASNKRRCVELSFLSVVMPHGDPGHGTELKGRRLCAACDRPGHSCRGAAQRGS